MIDIRNTGINSLLASEILNFSSDIAERIENISSYHFQINNSIRDCLSNDHIRYFSDSFLNFDYDFLAVDGSNFLDRKIIGDLCAVMAIGLPFNINEKNETRDSLYFVNVESRSSLNDKLTSGLMSLFELKIATDSLFEKAVWLDGSFISILNNIVQAFNILDNAPINSLIKDRFLEICSDTQFKHNFHNFLLSDRCIFFPKLSSIDFLSSNGFSFPDVRGIDTKILMHSILYTNEYIVFDKGRIVDFSSYQKFFDFIGLEISLLEKYYENQKYLFFKPWKFATSIRVDFQSGLDLSEVMSLIKNFSSQPDIYEPLPLFIVDRLVKDISIVCGHALDQSIISQLNNPELKDLFYRSYRTR